MTKEQQIQVRKLHEQKGIKLAMKKTSAYNKIAALEINLWVSSQTEEGDDKKTEGETSKEPAWESNKGNPAITCQVLDSKCKELG